MNANTNLEIEQKRILENNEILEQERAFYKNRKINMASTLREDLI